MGTRISMQRPMRTNRGLIAEVNLRPDLNVKSESKEQSIQIHPHSEQQKEHEEKTVYEDAEKVRQGDYQEAIIPQPQEIDHHGCQESNSTRKPSSKNHGSSFTQAIVDEIPKRIADVWEHIDNGLDKWLKINRTRPGSMKKGWKVVKLFVSSTFTDFYSEREMLIKRVVPQLNEWCLERKIQLIECDLRWGIPKDSTANDTINICLNEIEQCHEETGGQAFFLNLLGERYGWIPNLDEISQEVVNKYDLINGISITHTEILQASLRSKSKNALFLFRNANVILQLPVELQLLFLESTEYGQQSLAELKRQLRDRFPKQVLDYSCSFDSYEMSPESTKVTLTDLDEFGKKVIDYFKVAIERTYPQIDEDLAQDEWNFVFQDIFIEKKGALLVGREAERKEIIDFVSGSSDNYGDIAKNYMLVMGPSGIGKSSLLANVVRQLKATNVNCIYNFASASPGSTVSTSVREIFTRKLMLWLGLDPDGLDDLMHDDKIAKYHEMTQLIWKEQKQMTLVFDAVNQFSDNGSSILNWLPFDLKGNVKCIISCASDCQPLELIKKQLVPGSFNEMHITGFGLTETSEYIRSIFARYNKRLDEEQMEVLASRKEACNPLWLSLACEELRIFGEFERLTSKIRNLPDNLQELVFTVLYRLISEDETGFIRKVICFLVCSTSGLTETELRWGCGNGEEPLPMMIWKRCRLPLQPYLLMVGKRRGEENLAFFHDSFNIVVRTKLLADELEKKAFHSKLAKVFKEHCDDDFRVAEELPSQLQLANEFRNLVEFYSKDKRSIRNSGIEKSFRLQKIRCQMKILGTQDMFCSPVYICSLCSHRTKALTPLPDLNKDVCVICGSRVPFKSDRAMAYVCMRHRNITPPGTAKCYICETMIFLQQQKTRISFNQMYLCLHCSSLGLRCIKLQY